MVTLVKFFVHTDHNVSFSLVDELLQPIHGAEVTFTVKTLKESPVQTFTATETITNGKYQIEVTHDMGFLPDQVFHGYLTVVQNGDTIATLEVPCLSSYQTF
jgi:hypothetical protein